MLLVCRQISHYDNYLTKTESGCAHALCNRSIYVKCRWIRCVYKAAHWHALACLAFNYSNVEITTTTDECLQTVSLIGRFSKRCPSGKELYFSISKMLKCRFWSCLYTTGHVLNQLNGTNITTNMFNVHNLQYAALSYTTDLSGL